MMTATSLHRKKTACSRLSTLQYTRYTRHVLNLGYVLPQHLLVADYFCSYFESLYIHETVWTIGLNWYDLISSMARQHNNFHEQKIHCYFYQGSCRSSIVKFPDFSLTFQVIERQFPRPYRNNNPITQTLEMVRYIPRFIITMKHVIYGAILNAARGPGGAL